MAVRPIDALELRKRMCAICNQDYADEPCEPSDCFFIRVLNETPTLTPPNEPLTLEELREMEGKPFWDCASREWYIVAYVAGSRLYTETGTYVDFAEEETEQRFYCRPPEGDEET